MIRQFLYVLNSGYFPFNQNYKKFKMGTNSKELYWESFKKIEKIVEFPKSKLFVWEFHKEVTNEM